MATSENPAFFPSSLGPIDSSPTSFFVGNQLWRSLVEQKNVLSYQHPQQTCPVPQTNVRRTQLQSSLEDGFESMSMDELSEIDELGNTSLHLAVEEANENLVKFLVDQGSEINAQNIYGQTALFAAAARGFDRIVRFLLMNGSNSGIATMEGVTAAHIAAAGGHLDVLLTLATHGAWLNAQDEEGDTPLHYCIREGHEKVVEFLVRDCRVQTDLKNEDLETPLQLASCLEETKLVQLLSAYQGRSLEEVSVRYWGY